MASSCSTRRIPTPSFIIFSPSASSGSPTKPSLLSFLHNTTSTPISLKLSNSLAYSHSDSLGHSLRVKNAVETIESASLSVSKTGEFSKILEGEKPTILVSEKLGEAGLEILRSFGDLDCSYDLSPEDLCKKISSCDALIVRSSTKVTRQVFEAAKGGLKVVGRAGVGIDNVDLQAATEFGCLVVNAPTANTVAAAEHGIALLAAMARNVAQADASMKAGERKVKLGCNYLFVQDVE